MSTRVNITGAIALIFNNTNPRTLSVIREEDDARGLSGDTLVWLKAPENELQEVVIRLSIAGSKSPLIITAFEDASDKPATGLFKVLTWSEFGGWEDTWTEDDEPLRFPSWLEAQKAIQEYIAERDAAGLPWDARNFRTVPADDEEGDRAP